MRAEVSIDQIATLLTTWHTHQSFSGAYGLPTDLDLVPIQSSPRKRFEELVAIACPGIDTDVLLDELVAAGTVEVIDNMTVRCLSRAYVLRGADAEINRIERAGRFLGVVSENFAHNLLRAESEPLYFERTVVSDESLSNGGRDKFLEVSGQKCQEVLAELDTYLTRLVASERHETGKKYGVGIYFFEERAAEGNEQRVQRQIQESNSKAAAVEEIDVLAAVHRKD